MLELNKLYLMDCMEGMAQFPDKHFDLAIVDPPYGITKEKWDIRPNQEYFDELFRVSEKQIIWGGNYFNLSKTQGWICWHKTDGFNNRALNTQSDFELAWTSFLDKSRLYPFTCSGNIKGLKNKKPDYRYKPIHPTQKPSQIYQLFLIDYAQPNFKIIDTHAGSCSSVIAFLDYGCDWIAFEIDKDYCELANKRIENHKLQLKLF